MFSFIAAEKANYPVAALCRALSVNRTSFHDWERRPPSDRALQDAWLLEQIKQIHESKRRVYGLPGSTLSCGWPAVCGSGASVSNG